MVSQLNAGFKVPVFAQILESRPTTLLIVSAAVVHGGLNLLGLPSWECPIRHTLGVPCPGCGLSRAMGALLHGDWQTAMTYHAFAPIFLASLIFMAVVLLLPAGPYGQVVDWTRRFETKTGLVAAGLVGLMIYWVIRLVFFREAFFVLIMG
jgi:hypothetical protein